MKWVEVKMRELGVSTNSNYKLTCMLDCRAMLTVGAAGPAVGGPWDRCSAAQHG